LVGVALTWFRPDRGIGRAVLLIGGLMAIMSGLYWQSSRHTAGSTNVCANPENALSGAIDSLVSQPAHLVMEVGSATRHQIAQPKDRRSPILRTSAAGAPAG
jgi:hypothetical protein